MQNTQLILYPQNYSGYAYNAIPRYSTYNYDPYFLLPGNIGTYQMSITNPPSDNWFVGLYNSAPFIAGSWVAFYTNGGSYFTDTVAPTINSGSITLTGQGGGSQSSVSGLAQPINNLIIGATYDLTVSSDLSAANGTWQLGNPGNPTDSIGNNGTILPTNIVPNGTGFTHTFQATANSMHLCLNLFSNLGAGTFTCNVTNILIQENIVSAEIIYSDIKDGQVICDLYQEEDIPLTLSVDDFTNILEKTQSYSKDFNLPNTKRNAKIFTHIFDITKTISNTYDFNPYAKTKATLKENGVVIFEGSLRLIEIQDNKGEISYNVNLFAETISIADVLKSRTFANLDFSELAHDYNKSVITLGFYANTGTLLLNPIDSSSLAYNPALSSPTTHTDVILYPFVNWEGDLQIADGSSGNTSNLGFPELTSFEQVFRPFVQLKYLIDKIFQASGYEYTSSFFDQAHFKKLYMDFNWGSGQQPSDFTTTNVGKYTLPAGGTPNWFPQTNNWALAGRVRLNATSDFPSEIGWDSTNYEFDAQVNGSTYNISFDIRVAYDGGGVFDTGYMQWVKDDGAGTITILAMTQHSQVSGTWVWSGSIPTTQISIGEKIYCRARANVTNKVGQPHESLGFAGTVGVVTASVSFTQMTSGVLLNNLRGELGQWDFFKGIMTMFNLVAIPDPANPNNVLIEPYNDVFGIQPSAVTPNELNWTEKIDVEEIKLKPLDLVKTLKFQYEEDDSDFAFLKYKRAASGYLYGSKDIQDTSPMLGMYGNMQTGLSGEEEIIASPFASTICKPLGDQWSEWVVPVIYSGNEDGTDFNSYENKPRILYNNGRVDMSGYGYTYYIPAQNGTSSTNQPDFLQFSHLSDIPTVPGTTKDYNFGICQFVSSALGSPVTDNLYKEYYLDYFSHLYNPNTRIVTLKVNLNASDINQFKFYDIVTLKNRQYRVNKIFYKPNELSIVEFILLN